MSTEPSSATDPATATYYDTRAGEYDDWYTGAGTFASRGSSLVLNDDGSHFADAPVPGKTTSS